MKPYLLPALTTLALVLATPAFAHDDATLDRTAAPNGGQLRMSGAYHLELVVAKDSASAKDNQVAVYVTDHGGKKLPVAGAAGTVTLLSGKTKVSVPLTPAGDNKLTGKGIYASDPRMKAVVALTLADKQTAQARFTPLAAASHGHDDGHDHGALPLAVGTVKKIDKAAGEVVIAHGPLDSLGMPPMTMAFGVADKGWLDKLKAGDKIRFAAEMKQGGPVVSRYETAK